MLDLRKPIAYFFLINATILIVYGFIQPGMVQMGQQTLNLDLVWGLVMGAFGGFMLGWSLLEKKKA